MNQSSLNRIETTLTDLHRRLPELPVTTMLLCRVLLHLGRGMSVLLEHEIRPCGLVEAEFRVLTTLFSQPGGVAHPSDLCARTSQSPANMSRISDVLVGRGLITRVLSQQDRRRMVLRITEAGEELVRRLLPTVFGPLRTLFSDLSEDDQRRIIGQLKQLGGRLEAALDSTPSERAP